MLVPHLLHVFPIDQVSERGDMTLRGPDHVHHKGPIMKLPRCLIFVKVKHVLRPRHAVERFGSRLDKVLGRQQRERVFECELES